MRSLGRFSIRPLLALTLAVAAAVVPLSPARAEGNLTCAFEDTITTTPGLRNTRTRYTFVSEARATITCFGTLGDVVVAGTGWFIEKGTGYGTCLEAEGSIELFGELPTADGGNIEVTGHLWAVRAGLTGTATGFINGGPLDKSLCGTPSPGMPVHSSVGWGGDLPPTEFPSPVHGGASSVWPHSSVKSRTSSGHPRSWGEGRGGPVPNMTTAVTGG